MSHRFRLLKKIVLYSFQRERIKKKYDQLSLWPSDLDLFGIIVTLGTLQKDSY